MNKMVVLTPNDEIKMVDYEGYKSIHDAVEGNIEYFGHFNIDFIPFDNPPLVDFICNEEFLLDDSIQKVNALATCIVNGLLEHDIDPIYGNVALLIADGRGDNRGFEYIVNKDGQEEICESWLIEDLLIRHRENTKEILESIHKEFDNNKPAPEILVTGFTNNYEEEWEMAQD